MSKAELDNLVKIRRLKTELPTPAEYQGMLTAARSRLKDAQNEDLDSDSRFDLAYGAAHRLALAALRREGYRSENWIIVFRRSCIRSGPARRTCKYFSKLITSETSPNTRVDWKSTKSSSPT